MTDRKTTLLKLDKAYTSFIDLILTSNNSLDQLDRFVADDVMGYGTTLDEKIHNLKGLKDLAILQREQSGDMKFNYERIPVFQKVMDQSSTAIIVDEIKITMQTKDEKIELEIRLSSIMEFVEGNWKVRHWHGSKPEYDSGGADPWHREEWKAKNEELQLLVDKKTIELAQKNRELEIDAALERTRTQSMLMQHSSELDKTSKGFHEQLQKLGIQSAFSYLWLLDEANEKQTFWATYSEEKNGSTLYSSREVSFHLDKTDPYMAECLTAWKEGEKTHVSLILQEEVEHYLNSWDELFSGIEGLDKDYFPEGLRFIDAYMKYGTFGLVSNRDLKKEEYDILCRFAIEFERAYTRFLDLKKSEEQAREAQIEVALERVRARSMAMHQSDELKDVIKVIFDQMTHLNINAEHAGIVVDYKPKKDFHFWVAETQDIPSKISVPYLDLVWDKQFTEAKKKGMDFFTTQLDFEEKNSFYKDLLPHIQGLTKKARDFYFSCPGLAASTVIEKDIGLYIENFSGIPYTDEENNILMRFGKVFQQTYTRFNDLKQAEAQAREAQIESALEKVRSRSIGMQKSEELKEVIQVIHDQLIHLNFEIDAAGFTVDYFQNNDWNVWIANKQQSLPTLMYIPYTDHPQFNYYKGAKEKGLDFFANTLSIEEKNSIFKYMFEFMGDYPQAEKDQVLNAPGFAISQAFLKNITLWIYNLDGNPYSEEDNTILMRFAKVFEQTYVRFNDLQKAESQAKEAQTEASLERVRSRAMAIRKSGELMEVIQIIFQEMDKLGFDVMECSIVTHDINPKDLIYWTSSFADSGLPASYKLQYIDHPVMSELHRDLENGVKYRSGEFSGELLQTWWDKVFTESEFKDSPIEYIESWKKVKQLYYSQAAMGHGFLEFLGSKPLPEDKVEILKRLTKVVDLTYTRFDDVVKAEAQAREAQIETALERVRARALAMQEPEELKEVSKTLRYEMGQLGIEELETCSIYINDKSAEHAECWYAIKDIRESGKKLVSDHFSLNLSDTWVGREMKKFYDAKDKQVSILMTGEPRIEWIKYCEEKSDPLLGYYGNVIPDRTYHLYKFSHGAIGIATPGDVSEENWALLKRVAAVFSLAYSRFKDLTQALSDLQLLKEEKLKAETALARLKSTQSQLIHAEKMASLGELTAGIAHEIQNPLNFVNNFSEVSADLIDEMNEEIDKGETEEVRIIAGDLKSNLEKITHHGKRASSIVKGMLEHSRAGSDEKQPTDLNALADEYIRLAYHGLRAKDRSFNADFKVNLDEHLPKVNLVGQDIARVILNLINNAFQAVHEKSMENIEGYKPAVVVSTSSNDGRVEIRVKDNGPGIPNEIKDKIFQPFFTTKPAGEGTGLGLSLSYDIVKAHGGNISLNTLLLSGTEFIITLPHKR